MNRNVSLRAAFTLLACCDNVTFNNVGRVDGLTIPQTFTAVSCAFSLAEMSAMLARSAK